MKKYSYIQVCLTILYVCCFLISNITASRMIMIGPLQLPGAVILFPVTYVLSDVFSEVYGYDWSRKTCYLAFWMNLLMVAVFAIAINLPAPAGFDAEPFSIVLGSAPKALAASLAGYVAGDFVNDRIFRRMKEKDGQSRFALRAFLSSVFGELIDSGIFISVMFLGVLPVEAVVSMIFWQACMKLVYELIVLPVTSKVVKVLNAKESCIPE